MRPAVLLGAGLIPAHVEQRMTARRALPVIHAHAASGDHPRLAVVQDEHIARMADERGNIRGDMSFPGICGKAHHQRALLPRAEQLFRLHLTQDRQRIAALQLLHGAKQGAFHVAVIQRAEQVRNHLRIGLADAGDAQLSADVLVIFDDAVVHHGDLPPGVRMRMGVQPAGLAMRGPPCVADARAALRRTLQQNASQVFNPPLFLADQQFAISPQHCNARAVVAPVGEFVKPLHQHRRCLFRAQIPHNAAHAHPSPDDDMLYSPRHISTGSTAVSPRHTSKCRCGS